MSDRKPNEETPGELRQKIDAAWDARHRVRQLSLDERADRIRRCGERLASASSDLINGMVRAEKFIHKYAKWQVEAGIQVGRAGPRLIDHIRPQDQWVERGRMIRSFEPYGVAGVVPSANSPVRSFFYCAMSALGAGNACVVRPSSIVSETSKRVYDLIAPEWPEGTLQMSLASGPVAMKEMVASRRIGVICVYAGSDIGKEFIIEMGRNFERGRAELGPDGSTSDGGLKKFVPELSGTDAFVVLPGADIPRALEAAVAGGFLNSGQICIAGKRILVHRSVWDEFRVAFVNAANALKIGELDDPEVDIGPLQRSASLQSALRALEDAKQRGAKVLCGGTHSGMTLRPTLVEFTPEMILAAAGGTQPLLWTSECFAPIRPIVAFESREQLMQLATSDRYGLGGCLFGAEDECVEIASRLEVGRVVINEHPLTNIAELPIGGIRDSGLYGANQKIEEMSYKKLILVGGSRKRSV